MTISSLSSASSYVPGNYQNTIAQRRASFAALQASLKSGDLSGAQKAFAALQQLAPAGQSGDQSTSAGSQTGQVGPIGNDFTALGKALQSGDLSGAQDAFTQLKSDMQSARQAAGIGSGHHHHHHHRVGGGDVSITNASDPTAAAAQSSNDPSSTNLLV